jgi:uncharacterized protein YutD
MKYLHLFSLFILSLVFATTIQAQGKDKDLKGTFKEKPWAKSGQSYCAQGSNYFVLVEKNGAEHVLDFSKDAGAATQYRKWLNKPVRVKGDFTTRTIKANKDEISQRPISYGPDGKEISSDYTCTVFTVKSINPEGKGNDQKGHDHKHDHKGHDHKGKDKK